MKKGLRLTEYIPSHRLTGMKALPDEEGIETAAKISNPARSARYEGTP